MPHVREHGSILAVREKRLLIAIAERLPAWVSSDWLSALSLASMVLAGLSFAAFRWTPWAAAGVALSLFANWFGDSLDGTVARVRHMERPRFGFYADHAIDMAGTTFLLCGLACSTLMKPAIAFALLAAFLLTAGETFLAAHTVGVFRLSFLAIGPTELRLALTGAALRAAFSPLVRVAGREWLLFDIAGVAGAAGLALGFATAVVRNTATLYAAEPAASRSSSDQPEGRGAARDVVM